jgi:hypothetical protein
MSPLDKAAQELEYYAMFLTYMEGMFLKRI